MSTGGDGFDVRSLALTFRAGAVLADHRHPWGQLVFASRGVMRVRTSRYAWTAPPTKAIWIPGDVDHHIEMCGEVAMRTLYIAPERAVSLALEPVALEVAPLLRELILHILAIGMLSPSIPDQDRLAAVLVDLLLVARAQDLALPLPNDKRARRLSERLLAHPDDPRGLGELSMQAGASLRTMQRLFLKETQLTIEAWRQKTRLIHAVTTLGSGGSVTDAALSSGYQSVGAFISAFKRQFDVTPGRYFM